MPEAIAWSEQERAAIEDIVSRYPDRRAVMLPVLWMAQHKFGWLSFDVLRLVSETVGQPPSEVLSVATFYSMLKKKPHGEHVIQVCHTLSCALQGADRCIDHMKKTLGIKEGETTADGKFTLQRVECLASCGSAPMMQIDEHYYEFLTEARIDAILEGLRNGEPLPTPCPEADEWRWAPTDRTGAAGEAK